MKKPPGHLPICHLSFLRQNRLLHTITQRSVSPSAVPLKRSRSIRHPFSPVPKPSLRIIYPWEDRNQPKIRSYDKGDLRELNKSFRLAVIHRIRITSFLRKNRYSRINAVRLSRRLPDSQFTALPRRRHLRVSDETEKPRFFSRNEVNSVLALLPKARYSFEPSQGRSKHSRISTLLSLALNLALFSKHLPILFQRSLRPLLPQMTRQSTITSNFRSREILSRKITYTPTQLVYWLVDNIVTNPSWAPYITLVTRVVMRWKRGEIPPNLVNALIWQSIPRRTEATSTQFRRKYGLQVPQFHIKEMRIAGMRFPVSIVTHAIRHGDRTKLDFGLINLFMKYLTWKDDCLSALQVFNSLNLNGLAEVVENRVLMVLFRQLVETDNCDEAWRVMLAIIRFDGRKDELVNSKELEAFIDVNPRSFVNLVRGLRTSAKSQEPLFNLLRGIPQQVYVENHAVTAEALRCAGSAGDKEMVRRVLSAIGFPFLDGQHVPNEASTAGSNFSSDLWSAILYAHVQLGLFDASQFILQSKQANGFQPGPEDTSIIICGLAKANLESGYALALKLSEGLTIRACEELLELALQNGHTEMIAWAKAQVAYQVDSWLQFELKEGLQDPIPTPFMMSSVLSEDRRPTRTNRAVGAIIKHVAITEGFTKAAQILDALPIRVGRDVYDTLCKIAFKAEEYHYAFFLSTQMLKQGWMPHNYRYLIWKKTLAEYAQKKDSIST